MATTLVPPWHHSPPPSSTAARPRSLLLLSPSASRARRRQCRAVPVSPRAFFGRADLDGFVQGAWQGANAGAERLSFEARQAAQRLDGWFSISRRLAEAASAARARAVEIDAELGLGRRWRSFSVDFSRNWPRYRRELSDFIATPIGRALTARILVTVGEERARSRGPPEVSPNGHGSPHRIPEKKH